MSEKFSRRTKNHKQTNKDLLDVFRDKRVPKHHAYLYFKGKMILKKTEEEIYLLKKSEMLNDGTN